MGAEVPGVPNDGRGTGIGGLAEFIGAPGLPLTWKGAGRPIGDGAGPGLTIIGVLELEFDGGGLANGELEVIEFWGSCGLF